MIRRHDRGPSGFIVVTLVLVMTVLAIIIPALVLLVRKDSKDSVQTTKKTTALQVAEAGQDRAAWKLRESDIVWSSATAGYTITGYHNDTEHVDVPGGKYKILISTSADAGAVEVISKGKADGSDEVRAIKAKYSKAAVAGALSVVGGLEWKPNLIVEWGRVVSYNYITNLTVDK